MLDEHRSFTTLPARDMERARSFWEETVGIPVSAVLPGGILFETAHGSAFIIFPSLGSASGTHTQLTFMVEDLAAEVTRLAQRGVQLEEYDLPTIKTVDHIAKMPGTRMAWFRDSEGNTISLVQLDEPEEQSER